MLEIEQAARAYYQQLCEANSAWKHMPSTGCITDGGCESFEAWFMVNDGPVLWAILQAEDAE